MTKTIVDTLWPCREDSRRAAMLALEGPLAYARRAHTVAGELGLTLVRSGLLPGSIGLLHDGIAAYNPERGGDPFEVLAWEWLRQTGIAVTEQFLGMVAEGMREAAERASCCS